VQEYFNTSPGSMAETRLAYVPCYNSKPRYKAEVNDTAQASRNTKVVVSQILHRCR